MKFVCDRDMVHAALVYLAKFPAKLSTYAATQYSLYMEVKGDTLLFRTTPQVICIEVSIPVPVEEEGEVMIDGKLLAACIGTLNAGDVTVSGKKRLTIKQGTRKRRIGVADADLAILFPKIGTEIDITVEPNNLIDVLSHIDFARAKDDTGRPILSGIHLDFKGSGLAMATDSFRAAFMELGIEASASMVIMPAGVSALKGALKLTSVDLVHLYSTPPGWIGIDVGKVVKIAVGVVDGEYPKRAAELAQSLPTKSGATIATLNKRDILPVLEMACALSKLALCTGASQGIVMTIGDGYIEIEAIGSHSDEMKDRLVAETTGEVTFAKMQPLSLLQAIKAAPSDEIKLQIWGPLEPILVSSTGGWKLIAAPMGGKDAAEEWAKRKQATEEDDEGD